MPSKKDQLFAFLGSADMDKIDEWGHISIDNELYNAYDLIMKILLECQETNKVKE